jgi:DNA-nicking Smr family endonuclease
MSIEFIPDSELDFHNFGVLNAAEIEKLLSEFIEDSYIANKNYLLIITGKGKFVRPLVKNLLRENKYIKSFKTAGYFNGQDGAFEVVLKSD